MKVCLESGDSFWDTLKKKETVVKDLNEVLKKLEDELNN